MYKIQQKLVEIFVYKVVYICLRVKGKARCKYLQLCVLVGCKCQEIEKNRNKIEIETSFLIFFHETKLGR